MDETRIRERLDDLARGAGTPDLSELGRRTVGRARRRRALNVVASALAIAGLATGGYVGVRSILETPVQRIGTPDPSVTPDGGGVPSFRGFPGLWPETDADALAEAQAAADDGHQPLRTTPEGTAVLAAVNLLGWAEADVQIAASGVSEATTVEMRNRRFADEVPPVTVTLQQLGERGELGIWTVISMSTPLIHVAVDGDPSRSTLRILGEVTTLYEGATTLQVSIHDGPGTGDAIGQVSVDGGDDGAFELEAEPTPTPDGRAVLLFSLPDAEGRSLGAVLMVVPTPTGEPADLGLDVTGVPPDVAATAQRIYDAIPSRDFDALASLLDPMTFVFDFSDGGDPIPAWREDPSVLDLAVLILEVPAAAPREIDGYGTFYIWPYLIDSDVANLSDRETADLHSLGYDDRDIELMVQGGNGYQGPRLAIDADGLWRNYLTVGE